MKIVSHGLNTLNEAGKYTCATAEYAGMFSYSCFKKGGDAVKVNLLKITRPVASTMSRPFVFIKEGTSRVVDKTARGLNTLNEAGKYTCATAEYAGMVSCSCMKRGGNAVWGNVLKITRPVTSTISRPFVFIKKGASKIFYKTSHDVEALKRLEDKISQIEGRLSSIEKHGVVHSARSISQVKETKLDTGKKKLLHAIVEENKLLAETL
ncbi:MAG TPA: hypothetical protein VMW78_01975 [Anaerolineae bacterium]|nr:hypothetical protein [Anaerolineae bacterium]